MKKTSNQIVDDHLTSIRASLVADIAKLDQLQGDEFLMMAKTRNHYSHLVALIDGATAEAA